MVENGAAWNLAHSDTYTQGIVGGVVELKGPLKVMLLLLLLLLQTLLLWSWILDPLGAHYYAGYLHHHH